MLTGVKITNDASCAQAADILTHKGVQTVIITLGSRGAFVATRDARHHVPRFNVKQVDTTAAGDVFNGALAVALAEGTPLLEAVRFANAAGALAVTRLGAQPLAPNRKDIDKLVGQHKLISIDGPPSRPPQALHMHQRSRRRVSAASSRQ